jgi:2C-methyl-D-erythritol 2,4-cyclodiphosphate synthase
LAGRGADAILGALGQPDIGQLFPDNDPKWKGKNSDVFVKEAVRTFLPDRFPMYGNVIKTTTILGDVFVAGRDAV